MLRIYQGLTANVAQRDILDITATDSHIGFIGNFNSVPADVDRCAVCIDVVILRYLVCCVVASRASSEVDEGSCIPCKIAESRICVDNGSPSIK